MVATAVRPTTTDSQRRYNRASWPLHGHHIPKTWRRAGMEVFHMMSIPLQQPMTLQLRQHTALGSSRARTVGRLSPLYGVEMKVGTPYAMHVVCSPAITFSRMLTPSQGLYHKLHGVTRPVAMKKSTIKRRKRVVPAIQDQVSDQSPTSFANSNSPEASPAMASEQFSSSPSQRMENTISLGIRSRESTDLHGRYEPPPIDFTGYQAGRPPPLDQQEMYQQRKDDPRRSNHYHPPLQIPPIQTRPTSHPSAMTEHTRKRSFSIAEGTRPSEKTPDSAKSPNRLSSISSILNPPQHSLDEDSLPLEPVPRRGNGGSGPTSGANSMQARARHTLGYAHAPYSPPEYAKQLPTHEKEGRKAKLRREADDLREMLRAKERELEEMGDVG